MFRILFIFLLMIKILSADQLEKVSIQLQWLDQFQFAGYYIAKEKGFYTEAGLSVEIKKYQQGIDVVDEVVSKKATFGVGRSSLLVERGLGKKIKILNVNFQASPLVFLARKDSGINSIEDFKNKKIMATTELVDNASLRAMMNKYGIGFRDMIVQKHSFNYQDLIDKKTDLMASYISNEPYRMKKQGIDYTVFDPKDHGFETYGDLLFTSEEEIKSNPLKIKAFMEASLQGWEYAFNNIDETVNIIFQKYNGQKKSKDELKNEALELKKLAYYKTDELGQVDYNKVQRVYDLFNIMGLIKNNYNIDEVLFQFSNEHGINLNIKEQQYLKTHPVIKIQNEQNWPPFNYNENDTPMGFSIDYMQLLAKKLGISIEIVTGYTWSQYMQMLQGDELDAIVNIVKTKERSKSIVFTEPFYSTQNVIYVNKNNPSFQTLSDLEYQKIAMAKGFYTQSYLEKAYPNIKQVLVKDQLEALKLLSLGKVDGVIAKKVIGDYLIAHNNIASVTATKYINDDNLFSHLRIGAAKKNKILIDILKKAQKTVSYEERNSLIKKWFGTEKEGVTRLSNLQKEYLKKKKVIKICTNNKWAPIEFVANGTPKGISLDMLKMLEKRYGLNFKYIPTTSWKESQEYLEKRLCDILPSAIKTKERSKYANFTKVYKSYDLAIITTEDKPLVAGISSVADKIMVRNEGSGLISKLQKKYPSLQIHQTQSYKDSFMAVCNKKAYFTIATPEVFNYYKNIYDLSNLKIAGYTKRKYDLRIAVRSDDKILLSIMDQVLNSITDDTHDIFYEKWVNQSVIKEIDYELIAYIITGFGVLFFIVLFFMLRQNKLKETIEEQKVAFETLYQKSTDGILLVRDGKFIDCNESIIEMLGYESKDEFLKTNPLSLAPKMQPDGRESLEKANEMMRIALDQGSHSFEWLHKRANKKEFWTEIVLTKINISGKDILHVVWRDIDKRKHDEKLLEEMNTILTEKIQQEVEKNREKDKKMLAQSRLAQMGEMISMIAHQWRQPLAAIGSTAMNLKFKLELQTYDFSEDKQIKECEKFFVQELGDIEKYVQNLTTTIEDFRNFYRPNKVMKEVLIHEPIKMSLSIVKNSLEAEGIELIENYNDSTILEVYDSELMQVFLNIIKNAQDVLKEKELTQKTIIITTEDIEEGVSVTISDNGGGISQDIMQNIFDPYFSTKMDKNGTGLGLYMCKTIVEEHHNGILRVYNCNDGACFEVIIKKNV